MSERDRLSKEVNRIMDAFWHSDLPNADGPLIDAITDFILNDRRATVQKVVGPLTKYAGLSSHSGRVYADIDESLKLAKEVCK